MDLNPTAGEWIFKPDNYRLESSFLEIETEPGTDFWQRTYYGFKNDNAPGFLYELDCNFSLCVGCSFDYNLMFDQCGLLLYIDSENWMKAGLEYENKTFSRLGSVVTNNGYSDWATTDVPNRNDMYFMLHRRGPDFMLESSEDGKDYRQMRIFHMHALGETTSEMGKSTLLTGPEQAVRVGFYACSPGESSFTARFSGITITESQWRAH